MERNFWRDKRVFVTGHTGFKGSWLTVWLKSSGARVTGFSLEPPTTPNLFQAARVSDGIRSIIGDVRDRKHLGQVVSEAEPEVVFHLAAQPLVRESYEVPVETYATNVMGTVNLLDSLRSAQSARAIVNITSDKCYRNNEWVWPYRETESLGGHDPYSNSKACSELVTEAFRSSFFGKGTSHAQRVGVASARAGNVIGGGDWASDRLLPDIIRALARGEPVMLRHPNAIRPWQHVLEPLNGYLMLAERLWTDADSFSEAWNFGPNADEVVTVSEVVTKVLSHWPDAAALSASGKGDRHEATHLALDSSKARARLGWKPQWDLDEAVAKTVQVYRLFQSDGRIRDAMESQVRSYLGE